MLTSILIGAGVMAGLVIFAGVKFARPVARFLLSLATAREAFRATWTETPARSAKSTAINAGPRLVLDSVQAETVEALAGLGMNRKTAEARVRAEGTAADVATLVRKCTRRAA